MGELIICALAAATPSLLFGVLLYVYVRGERAALIRLAEDGFRHVAARDAKDASEAKAMQMYQEEAMREQQIQFDRWESAMKKEEPRPVVDRVKACCRKHRDSKR